MTSKQRSIVTVLWAITAMALIALVAMIWMLHGRFAAAKISPALNDSMPLTPAAVSAELPIYFDAPTFSLTDENGRPFGSEQLRGKVWVADFIFTTCPGLCPIMTHHMAGFQKQSNGSAVQMVSFSVDPEHDTPAVLKDYAQNAGADLQRWHFLTGSRAQTWDVSRGMKLAIGQDQGQPIMHSSHLMLVDGNGKVRGIYDAEGSAFDVNGLMRDAKSLEK